MIRILIIFLALSLPLQLSWAAMATYCQTEKSLAPTHPGHHEHPTVEDEKRDGSGGATASDNDLGCSVCHFSCMKSVQFHSWNMVSPAIDHLRTVAMYSTHPASHIAEGPDKPNWLLAA